jgi:hypothetical protein
MLRRDVTMKSDAALLKVAERASIEFDGASGIRRFEIERASLCQQRTNGKSIDCGELARGKKSFTFSIWLDQVVRCPGDDKGQKYFWYGVIVSSKGALRDLTNALPAAFQPKPISYRDGPAYLVEKDLQKVKTSSGGTFRRFRDEMPTNYLGRILEERYPRVCFLGRFERCSALDDKNNEKLARNAKLLWRALSAAALKSARQGTAATKTKYQVKKVTREYEVFPRHKTLQLAFEKWIEQHHPGRYHIQHDTDLVDVVLRERSTGRVTLVEVTHRSVS